MLAGRARPAVRPPKMRASPSSCMAALKISADEMDSSSVSTAMGPIEDPGARVGEQFEIGSAHGEFAELRSFRDEPPDDPLNHGQKTAEVSPHVDDQALFVAKAFEGFLDEGA